MLLNVIAKSSDDDLTTTGALKLRLFGSTAATTQCSDAVLSAVIRAASRWADQYVGYPLALRSYEERVPAFGTRRLTLNRTPVRAVRLYESTDDDALEVTSTQFTLDAEAGILERDDGWEWTAPLELELEERPVAGEESASWYAVYQAGYTYNGLSTDSTHYSTAGGSTDTGRTLPEDVEEAVLLRCRGIYEESVEGGGVQSETLGDVKTEYRNGGSRAQGGVELSAAELLLAPYQRVV